jgi:CRP-like cAMP-binding protein
MRAQFKQQPPAMETRLQFVDVLILAGRGKEAVPVLLSLADEVAAGGQDAKAVGLLKRIEELEPGRPDVEEKLAALVKKEFEDSKADPKWQPAGPAPELRKGSPAAKVTFSQRVSFDIEEIEDAELLARRAPAAEPEPPAVVEENPPAAVEPEVVAEVSAEVEPEPVVEAEPDVESAPVGTVTQEIRGAFRRFLSSLPGPEDAPPVLAAEPAKAEPVVEPDVEPEPEPASQATVEPEPESAPAPEPEPVPVQEPEVVVEATEAASEAVVEPETPIEAQAEPQPEPAVEPDPFVEPEPMSEETFQGQVLDLIEEVVQQPLPAAEPGAAADHDSEERPVRTSGVAESAQRLLASPLFRELQEAELLAVVRAMRLHTYEAGDVVMTEGERGDSLFIVTSGSVRTFVRNPAGHNFEMGVLGEGDFFGELSSLSGRPRGSTIVAASHAELLELGKKTVDEIARTHPRVRETLESVYIQRASSPEAAAIRAVPVDPTSRQRAIEVLEAYFGESRWDPRMRLRLADLLVKAGKQDDAVPLLVGLAGDLDKAGFPDKAIAILKKIEKIRRRSVEEVNLAPLKPRARPDAAPAAAAPAPAAAVRKQPAKGARQQTVESFSNWIVDVVRDAVAPQAPSLPLPPAIAPGYTKGLLASPLFQGLTEDELFTMIRELRLLSFDPGDIVITEGEPGQSLFILTAGSVKVSVRNAQGRTVRVTELRAGSFFGEMATVSGKPRTATVTAAQRCELLELDKAAVDQIAARHPRIREVLEEIYIARATSPEAARARGAAPAP